MDSTVRYHSLSDVWHCILHQITVKLLTKQQIIIWYLLYFTKRGSVFFPVWVFTADISSSHLAVTMTHSCWPGVRLCSDGPNTPTLSDGDACSFLLTCSITENQYRIKTIALVAYWQVGHWSHWTDSLHSAHVSIGQHYKQMTFLCRWHQEKQMYSTSFRLGCNSERHRLLYLWFSFSTLLRNLWPAHLL